jgi:hypothetical protein
VSDEEYVIVWEAPVIEKPEFRLYYDKRGNVMFYTCEKPDGDYIVVDTLTYAEARPDVCVVDGRLVRLGSNAVVSRLYHSDTGVLCEVEDVSVITEAEGRHWKLLTINIT